MFSEDMYILYMGTATNPISDTLKYVVSDILYSVHHKATNVIPDKRHNATNIITNKLHKAIIVINDKWHKATNVINVIKRHNFYFC